MKLRSCRILLIGLYCTLSLAPAIVTATPPIAFTDAAGRSCIVARAPQRAVSLVPAVTEILFRLGVGDAVCGVTCHDDAPPQAARKPVVGGFLHPSVERIRALHPDIVFIADVHGPVIAGYTGDARPRWVQLPLSTFAERDRTIRLLGRLFNREPAADALVAEIHASLAHTAAKIAAIPPDRRKRVMRLMGRDRIMTPGDGSFQNEMIRRAGGIPPSFGKKGNVVAVTLKQWQTFNPEVLYACGDDRDRMAALLDQPGWREVDAVENGRLFYFPCDLTCRLSIRSGYFVSCLAARIYADDFLGRPPLRPDGRIASRPVSLALDAVDGAEIVDSIVNDYIHKTLLVHLSQPMTVVSTLEGLRQGIRHVGNSYSPPQTWGMLHRIGLARSREQLMRAIGRDPIDTSLLFTGADMDNLSIQQQQFKAMTVYALVTAGVCSNALRMAEDVGAYYEPGTINMLILSNMRLSPRAMQRAVISATEAKTAALQDMDIRSSYSPMTHPATGTGTDNIIVVQGTGRPVDNAGGHSKLGELIARAVYAGVQDAVGRQNGIFSRRNLLRRLKERRLSLFGLIGDCPCGIQAGRLTRELETLLLDPTYSGFIEAALAISDQYERGLIADLGGFEAWCDQMATTIAGRSIRERQVYAYAQPLPPVLKLAFDALLDGLYGRLSTAARVD